MSKAKTDALEAQSAQRNSTRDRLLAKKPRTAKVYIVTDDDLVLAHEEALERLNEARFAAGSTPNGSLKAHEDEVAKLRAAIDDATICITFRSGGSLKYEELIDAHQPTPEQVKDAEDKGGIQLWNPDTFPPALIHASIVDPDDLTLEDVAAMWNEWNFGERADLFNAALDVNTITREVADAGNVFGGTHAFSPSSSTASRAASPTRTS